VFVHFVKSLVGEDTNVVNNSNFDNFLRFTSEDFIEHLEDERKKDEITISKFERCHYTLLFLFDLLQFCF
jgi:hypothetical protein